MAVVSISSFSFLFCKSSLDSDNFRYIRTHFVIDCNKLNLQVSLGLKYNFDLAKSKHNSTNGIQFAMAAAANSIVVAVTITVDDLKEFNLLKLKRETVEEADRSGGVEVSSADVEAGNGLPVIVVLLILVLATGEVEVEELLVGAIVTIDSF